MRLRTLLFLMFMLLAKPYRRGSPRSFAEAARRRGHRGVRYAGHVSDAAIELSDESESGEILILFGAGDIHRQVSPVMGRLEGGTG